MSLDKPRRTANRSRSREPQHHARQGAARALLRELERCGPRLTRLSADAHHPGGTFVEDTAILTGRGAISTRPGAPSTLGEVGRVREALMEFTPIPLSPNTVWRFRDRSSTSPLTTAERLIEPERRRTHDKFPPRGTFLVALGAATPQQWAFEH